MQATKEMNSKNLQQQSKWFSSGPDSITLAELKEIKKLLDAGRIADFYLALQERGYHYASWARGVANGSSIAGVAATDYLMGSAMLGLHGSPTTLTPEQIANIKFGMAQAYYQALAAIGERSNGVIERDINANEVWRFHGEVFVDNGLGIENWTLNAPFQIILDRFGEAGLDRFWENLRQTGGEGLDALLANLQVMLFMVGQEYLFSTPAAQGWFSSFPDDMIDLVVQPALTATSNTLTPQPELDMRILLDLSQGSSDVLRDAVQTYATTGRAHAPAYLVSLALLAISRPAQGKTPELRIAEVANVARGIGSPGRAIDIVNALHQLAYGQPMDKPMLVTAFQMANDTNIHGRYGLFSLGGLNDDAGSVVHQAMEDSPQGLAYRYAIVNTLPFALEGVDYSAHEAALTLHNATTGQGRLTARYLHDRLIANRVWIAHEEGMSGSHYGLGLPANRTYEIHYLDEGGQEQVLFAERNHPGLRPLPRQVLWFGSAGPETLLGNDNRLLGDHLYGGDGSDTLRGMAGNDYLEGGTQDDRLEGGDGSDTLIGGAQHDTYVLDLAHSGVDTIIDADGLGHLELDGQALQIRFGQLRQSAMPPLYCGAQQRVTMTHDLDCSIT